MAHTSTPFPLYLSRVADKERTIMEERRNIPTNLMIEKLVTLRCSQRRWRTSLVIEPWPNRFASHKKPFNLRVSFGHPLAWTVCINSWWLARTCTGLDWAQIRMQIDARSTRVDRKSCVKLTTFWDLWIRLATLRKSVCKILFRKLVLTCVDLRVHLARAQGWPGLRPKTVPTYSEGIRVPWMLAILQFWITVHRHHQTHLQHQNQQSRRGGQTTKIRDRY